MACKSSRMQILIPILFFFFGATDLEAQQDRIKEFPAQKCGYKLPGEDWNWKDTTGST